MSLVIAVKNNSVVYFGSDSQTTSGLSKINQISTDNLKVTKLKNDVLISGTGDCRTTQEIRRNAKLQEILGNNKITKEFLVKKYLPAMIEKLDNAGLILTKDNGTAEMNGGILIAQKDKLFYIKDNFLVFEIEKYVAMGSAQDLTLSPLLHLDYSKDINEQLLEIFHIAVKYDSGISSPFYFVNTQTMEYEFKEWYMFIIAKDRDRVYMALTVAERGCNNFDFETHYTKSNALLFKLKKHKHCIVGQDAHNMLSDIVKFNPDIFDSNIDMDNLVQNSIPKLKDFSKSYKCFESSNNEFRKKVFVAQNDKAYVISYNGYVQEIENFEVIGDYGHDICFGSFETTKDLPAMDRIKKAVSDFSKVNCEKPCDFVVIDTKNTKLRFVKM